MSFYFIRHFALIYFILHQSLDGVVVSTLAFHAGDQGSIPHWSNNFFKFPFSQSHPSLLTKPSSLKLATSGITHPSDAQKGESQVI